MHYSAKCGDLKAIQYLCSRGVSTEIQDEEGKTPLYCAVEAKQMKVVKELIRWGANIAIKDKNGMTPLHIAVNQNNLDIIKVLLPNVDEVVKRSLETKYKAHK